MWMLERRIAHEDEDGFVLSVARRAAPWCLALAALGMAGPAMAQAPTEPDESETAATGAAEA
ncbi:MAG: hypothetical protein CMN29_31780, partial [Sandaracinus sp.]|nr:hypothetical protein [Sandaracinus sp.]